jgi:DedD protein
MDETLKARLIGASILVVLAVILVPELLSGPKQAAPVATGENARATRTYTIDLGGAVTAGTQRSGDAPAPATPATLPEIKPAPAAIDTPAESSAPAGDAQPDLPRERAAPASAPPEPAPVMRPLADEVKPVPASPRGGLSVQVGAFGSAATARKLVDQLSAEGYSAYVAPLAKSGKTLYRVRVGPVPDRAAADQLAARLKARKLPATVVTGG